MGFDHERLDADQLAPELRTLAERLIQAFANGRLSLSGARDSGTIAASSILGMLRTSARLRDLHPVFARLPLGAAGGAADWPCWVGGL